MRVPFCMFASVCLVAHAHAQIHESDIILRAHNGAIQTGADDNGVIEYGVRVFISEFGLLPNWTNEPGFDSEPGAFAPSTSLHIDIVDAVRRWDGAEFLTIPPERITVTKSGNTITSPPVPQTVAGPVLGSSNAAGVIHQHAAFELLAPAETGVYLLALQLRDQAGTLTTSDAFWIVFNQNDDPQAHLNAAQWVQIHLAGVCYADCDANSTLNILDYICFGDAFAVGCP